MEHTLYLDVYFLVNFLCNSLILRLSMHPYRLSGRRIAAAGALGALGGLPLGTTGAWRMAEAVYGSGSGGAYGGRLSREKAVKAIWQAPSCAVCVWFFTGRSYTVYPPLLFFMADCRCFVGMACLRRRYNG